MNKLKDLTFNKSNYSGKLGLPPGSMVHVTDTKVFPTKFKFTNYNKDVFEQKESSEFNFSELKAVHDKVQWLNFIGHENTKLLLSLEADLDIHRLVLEDILNTEHRPKMEDNGKYLFISARRMEYEGGKNLQEEQISVILGKGYVLCFLEEKDDFFNPIYERLKNKVGKLRGRSSDYLLYVIIDLISDSYYKIFETLDEKIEELEEEVLNQPSAYTLSKIQVLRKELMRVKKSVYPLRELVLALEKSDTDLFHASTKRYFRDIYDHTISFVETIEAQRDILATLTDIYLSSVNNKTNQIMKVLTLVASIFIPLTFFSGVYGMNFEYIPELKYKYSYPIFWAVCVLTVVGMWWWFRKKKWL